LRIPAAEEGRHTLSNIFTKCHVHVVFSTKHRQEIISDQAQPRLWAYMAGICKNHQIIALEIGGTEDHVHLLFHLPPTLALSKAVLLLKSNSSKWMNEAGTLFAWQEGYGAFDVSASNLESVAIYIRNQKEHHRKMSFEDEYVALLNKHGIGFNPKYVFG
jgi:putative transposase